MNKTLTIFSLLVLLLSGCSNSGHIDNQNSPTNNVDYETNIEFTHAQTENGNNILLEMYLYGEKRQNPYYIYVTAVIDGQEMDVNDDVTCQVSDNNVLKAAGGNCFFAVGPGKAEAVIEYQDVKQTYNVEVVDSPPVKYIASHGNIKFNFKGETELIKIFELRDNNTLIRCKNIEWKTSDPDIVVVDDGGLIYAEKQGTAIIYATIGDITKIINVEVLSSQFNNEAEEMLNRHDSDKEKETTKETKGNMIILNEKSSGYTLEYPTEFDEIMDFEYIDSQNTEVFYKIYFDFTKAPFSKEYNDIVGNFISIELKNYDYIQLENYNDHEVYSLIDDSGNEIFIIDETIKDNAIFFFYANYDADCEGLVSLDLDFYDKYKDEIITMLQTMKSN